MSFVFILDGEVKSKRSSRGVDSLGLQKEVGRRRCDKSSCRS